MDDVATVNAFQNGEVDTTTIDGSRATADLLRQIAGMKDVQIRRGFTPAASLYELGQDSELFKDASARKAFTEDHGRLIQMITPHAALAIARAERRQPADVVSIQRDLKVVSSR